MALTDKLSAIGEAIREKTGKSDLLTLDQMPTEIASITTGEGGGGGYEPTAEDLTFSGDCSDLFSKGNWEWVLNNYGNKITTTDVTDMSTMFHYTGVTNIPFDINCVGAGTSNSYSMSNMFSSAQSLTALPVIKNARPSNTSSMFASCYRLREIPEDFDSTWDWTAIDNSTSSYSGDRSGMFDKCYSLRSIPMSFVDHGNSYAPYSYSTYKNLFRQCYALDEIVGLPVRHTNATWTSNGFRDTFSDCCRAKRITFATQEDGSPIEVQWKSQTIYLDSGARPGWTNNTNIMYYFNSGITEDKEVTDDASYQALKNDPDWWTMDYDYSRYNHDSAVETINSLPDTSAYLATAGGTNTIRFYGPCGSKTDGGAISNLTEEEIAVATAKGWTVTIS